MYGLTYGANSTDRVTVAAAASINNLAAATYLWLARTTHTTQNGRFAQKGLFASGNSRIFNFASTGTLMEFSIRRATTDLQANALLSNFSAYVNGNVLVWAFVYDSAGANGDQKLYIGSPTVPCAEPSAYNSQQVGSGSIGDDSSSALHIGNNQTPNAPFIGDQYVCSIYDSALTQAEIRRWQTRPSRSIKSGCVLHIIEGNMGSVGSQVDLTGNGNNGTITGATAASTNPNLALHGSLLGGRLLESPLLTGLIR